MTREDRHVRGWVRAFKATAPGAGGLLSVEMRLNDRRNVERLIRWQSTHYADRELVDALDFAVGDEAEVLLDMDKKGQYSKESFVQNHTKGRRYTLAIAKKGWWPFGR